MRSAIFKLEEDELQKHDGSEEINEQAAQLVLCFADRQLLLDGMYQRLKNRFPAANICLVSSAGEIFHTEVLENSASVAVLEFEATEVAGHAVQISDYTDSFEAGEALLKPLVKERNPAYVLVFSDGQQVNGSELVKGLNHVADGKFLVTGGLAGDGSNFQSTVVGLNEEPTEGKIIAVALYSDRLLVRHGSKGGWEPFGMMKMVTKSESNLLFEIDGENALDVYKKLLGRDADGLPEAALLFPLSIYLPGNKLPLVRTILSIDESLGSMTFAGDIPEGCFVRFMKANFDKITDAASVAAVDTQPFTNKHQFALLISCVGRKLILKSKAADEVKAVDVIFDKQTMLAGFYSYGEISPLVDDTTCQLHNQTMTITGFAEY